MGNIIKSILKNKKLIKNFKSIFCVFISVVVLSGCAAPTHHIAPVTDVNTHWHGQTAYHRVQLGETLYAIAWRYDRDYKDLAWINGLKPPYELHPGQNIRLNGQGKLASKPSHVAQKNVQRKPVIHRRPVREPTEKVHRWTWPAAGKVVRTFSSRNKGIDIAGKYGEPVRSTAAGKVVYAGDGIPTYGNLIIVKHNPHYLTAYAHNHRMLVHENQWVKSGQRIASMGRTTRGKVILHFEIRRDGRPLNPLLLLRR